MNEFETSLTLINQRKSQPIQGNYSRTTIPLQGDSCWLKVLLTLLQKVRLRVFSPGSPRISHSRSSVASPRRFRPRRLPAADWQLIELLRAECGICLSRRNQGFHSRMLSTTIAVETIHLPQEWKCYCICVKSVYSLLNVKITRRFKIKQFLVEKPHLCKEFIERSLSNVSTLIVKIRLGNILVVSSHVLFLCQIQFILENIS